MPIHPRLLLNLATPLFKGKNLVIVAGMPKSGTTAIAKLLAEAADVKVCSDPFHQLGERNVDFREELFGGTLPLEKLWRRYQHIFSGEIVKDPNFPLLLSQIVKFLPEAQLVSIIRDPRDNIRSILNRLNLPGDPQGVDLSSANIPATWRNVLLGKQPDIPGDDYVEVLAHRWKISTEAFLQHRKRCVEIRYEDFVAQKSASISKLAASLGYTQLANIDHLVDVQYQPKGDSAGRWKDFFEASQLDVINRVTGPLLGEFGYDRHTNHS